MTEILGSLEQKIMDICWKAEHPLKAGEILELLNERLAYTTINTVLNRLNSKGLLKRIKKGNYFTYQVKKSKKAFAENKLAAFFENLLSSYGNIAISQFVDTLKERPGDLELLKEYLGRNNDK